MRLEGSQAEPPAKPAARVCLSCAQAHGAGPRKACVLPALHVAVTKHWTVAGCRRRVLQRTRTAPRAHGAVRRPQPPPRPGTRTDGGGGGGTPHRCPLLPRVRALPRRHLAPQTHPATPLASAEWHPAWAWPGSHAPAQAAAQPARTAVPAEGRVRVSPAQPWRRGAHGWPPAAACRCAPCHRPAPVAVCG